MTAEAKGAYAIKATLKLTYEAAVEKTKEALKEQGFGVLTEIDVQKTMKDKLGADFRRYMILGACNPKLAHQALEVDLDLGVMLPCNVVVFEEHGDSVIIAQDPEAMLSFIGNPDLEPIAKEAGSRIREVVNRLIQQFG